MRFWYIIVPAWFALMMAGTRSAVNPVSYFNYAVTVDSQFVCSSNSVNDFPSQFDSLAGLQANGMLTIISLDSTDFPVDTSRIKH